MVNHPLNDTNYHSINLYLNSKDAVVSSSDSNKIFTLNNPIFAYNHTKILIGLSSFTCPNSIYNIDSTNNTIIIDSVSYALTTGNFDSDSIVSSLNALIPQTIAFNDGDNTFTISNASSFTISVDSTILKVLGFSDDVPFTGTSLTGSHICDLAGVTNINIKLSNLSMDNLDSTGNYDNTIASVNNTVNYGDYIFHNPSEVLYHAIHDKYIKFLKVELLDQNQNSINLNGSTFQMVLTIHFTYVREEKMISDLFDENQQEFQKKQIEMQKEQIKRERRKRKSKSKSK
jgi:hypothetical protein